MTNVRDCAHLKCLVACSYMFSSGGHHVKCGLMQGLRSRGFRQSEKRLTRAVVAHTAIDFTLKAQYLLDGLPVMEDG